MQRFEKIDVGYELTACITSGDAPVPVVHVNALGTPQDQWDQVLPRLYLHTTVTYDRPGIGHSDPLPPHLADQPRTFGAMADELRSMLDKLAIESPHVVVGHSVGALIALMYTTRHGAHTAGLVLVDCSTWQTLAGRHTKEATTIPDRRRWIFRDRSPSWTPQYGHPFPLQYWRAHRDDGRV